jgi:hypothetical protein
MLEVVGYKRKFKLFRGKKIKVLCPVYKDLGPASCKGPGRNTPFEITAKKLA